MALLSSQEVRRGVAKLGWEREGDELVTIRKCNGFAGAIRFVNAVADLAEEADHHPDIDIRWNTVTLRLSTHSEGGITQADLDLARKIDVLPEGRS